MPRSHRIAEQAAHCPGRPRRIDRGERPGHRRDLHEWREYSRSSKTAAIIAEIPADLPDPGQPPRRPTGTTPEKPQGSKGTMIVPLLLFLAGPSTRPEETPATTNSSSRPTTAAHPFSPPTSLFEVQRRAALFHHPAFWQRITNLPLIRSQNVKCGDATGVHRCRLQHHRSTRRRDNASRGNNAANGARKKSSDCAKMAVPLAATGSLVISNVYG